MNLITNQFKQIQSTVKYYCKTSSNPNECAECLDGSNGDNGVTETPPCTNFTTYTSMPLCIDALKNNGNI